MGTLWVIKFVFMTVLLGLVACGGGNGNSNSISDNTAPVAAAGNDRTVFVGEVVTLDGSGSSDAEGNTLTYLWTIDSMPQGSTLTDLADHMTAHPSFTPDLEGVYVFHLVVNDGLLNSPVDQVVVNAENCVVDRTYTINTPIQYSCAGGLHSLHVTSFTFTGNGSTSVPAINFPDSLTGASTSCPSGSFTHELNIVGVCSYHFTLEGQFTGPDTWSGTLTTEYIGSCFDCVGNSYNIEATAQ